MHPDIKEAIETFKQIQAMKEEIAVQELDFVELSESEAAEIECLDNLSSLLQRQAV